MLNHSTEKWSLCVGRWRNVELRLHILLPLFALVAFVADIADPWTVTWAIIVLVASIALHEVVRVVAAVRVGGHATSIVLGPVGGLTKLHLPVDPPAHLITAFVGPMIFFVLVVAAGCGLALAEDRQVHRLLLNPIAPPIAVALDASTFHTIGQLIVWVNWCLLLVSLLPIDPCAGAELLRSVLWPIVGRTSARVATSHFALVTGAILALVALLMLQKENSTMMLMLQKENFTIMLGTHVPAWFPLAIASVFLLYGGRRTASTRRYDVGIGFDEFDSDDEEWLASEWLEDDREAVLVEHLQDKQQEALDRKRRQREANEDARVDAILARLRDSTFEQLSEEERATLKRASRRYRQRRSRPSDDE